MDQKTLKSYIRVNHAGEYGAVRIYEGQRDALQGTATVPLIEEMLHQEQEHLLEFEKEMQQRKIRPTVLIPLWDTLGYGLGYISGKLGKSAAMACTQAVEEVIDHHYQQQLISLPKEEEALKAKISQFREDEIHHKNIALNHDAEQAPLHTFFTAGIRAATLFAIHLSKKI